MHKSAENSQIIFDAKIEPLNCEYKME